MQLCSQLSSCDKISQRRAARDSRTHLQLSECADAPSNPAQVVVVEHQGLQKEREDQHGAKRAEKRLMACLELHRVGRAVDDFRNARGLQAVVAEGQHAQMRHVEHAVRKRIEFVVV